MATKKPYQCPECGADLMQPGAIIFWNLLPENAVAHIEPGSGEDDSVLIILDGAHSPPENWLQCSNCGADINLPIEDIDVDPEFEETDDE